MGNSRATFKVDTMDEDVLFDGAIERLRAARDLDAITGDIETVRDEDTGFVVDWSFVLEEKREGRVGAENWKKILIVDQERMLEIR